MRRIQERFPSLLVLLTGTLVWTTCPTGAARTIPILGSTAPAAGGAQEFPMTDVDPGMHHLGDSTVEAWARVAMQPQGTELEVAFACRANATPWTLELRTEDVHGEWSVLLNQKPVATLRRRIESSVQYFEVPPDTLMDASNLLVLRPDRVQDDILVGEIRLHEAPLAALLHLGRVEVTVHDSATQAPLPARVTIEADDGTRPILYGAEGPDAAIRDGIAYTGSGTARFEVPQGHYRVAATRGMEWSLGLEAIEVRAGAETRTALALARQVDTRGFVAADTHIHTLTFSGHGDAGLAERVVTLAAEGVEFAVATDHNHQTDYGPEQDALQLAPWSRAITGNEVTTKVGHFNAFPLDPNGALPDHTLEDWTALVAGMRGLGARVVILNHPRWPSDATQPFQRYGLDPDLGTISGQGLTVDATELANSTALQDDPLLLFRDWFALQNGGVRLAAVGSSDSHTVGDPVGQGRTYVPSATDDPAAIDVDAACAAIAGGRTTIALGIFCDVRVNGIARCGDLVPPSEHFEVEVRVASADWIRPRTVKLFLDGTEIANTSFEPDAGETTDRRLIFHVGAPRHDAWLVAVALGDGVSGFWWPTQKDYTLGATNPVFLDGDGDGVYSSPRDTARRFLDARGGDAEALRMQVDVSDDAVAMQMIALARERGDLPDAALEPLRAVLTNRPRVAALLERVVAATPER